MYPTPLPARREDLADGGLQALVSVGNDQLNPAQTPPSQTSQKLKVNRLTSVPDKDEGAALMRNLLRFPVTTPNCAGSHSHELIPFPIL